MTVADPPVDPPVDLQAAQRDALRRSGWGRTFRFVQPRNAAFWLYLLLVGWGVLGIVQLVSPGTQIAQGSLATTTVVFALYAVPFLLFLHHIDRFRTVPGSLAVAAFVWGGFAATAVVGVKGNDALQSIYGEAFGSAWALSWSAPLAAPFTEELGKVAGLLLLITLAPRLIRTALDGLLVGSFIGLGFQIVEDVVYGFRGGSGGFDLDNVAAAVHDAVMRMGTGFFSHWLYSGIVGAGLVWLLGRPDEPARRVRGLVLIALAMVGHGMWDAGGGLLSVSPLFLPLTYVVVPVTLALTYRWIYRTSVVTERGWARQVLAPEVAADVVTQPEVDAFTGSREQRKAYVARAEHHRGHVAARHVVEAVGDLFEAICASGGAESPAVDRARTEVVRLRGTAAVP